MRNYKYLIFNIVTVVKNNIKMGNCQAVSDITVPSSFQGIVLNYRLWKKTYSNLFDYTAQPSQYSEQTLSTTIPTSQSSYFQKKLDEISIISEQNTTLNQYTILRLYNKNDEYFLEPSLNIQKLTANQVWLVVKSTPSKKYKLKEGDIVRIGNQKVKIKEIIFQDNTTDANYQIKSKNKVYESFDKNSCGYDPAPDAEQPICRVCLQQGQINNPLLSPCKCSGSAKFIHIKCIQEWFNKIINPHKVNSSLIITWKPLICELCNQSLPFKIYIDEVKHFTVNIPRPQKPYIVLNPIMKEKSSSKIYHLVSFNEKKCLTIGRKKDSDVVLDQDGSISRVHSMLVYEPSQDKNTKSGKIYVSDQDSKFGTLVLVKKPINLSHLSKGLTLQFGGSIVSLYTRNKVQNQPQNQQQINQSDKSTSTESVNNEENGEEDPRN